MSDVISNPSHYTKGRKYEPRKVIEDWDLDFYLGNALKYISRAGRKNNTIEDLQKAKQYLDFEIEKLENDVDNRTETIDNDIMASANHFGVSNFVILPSNEAPHSKEHNTPKYAFEYAMTGIDTAIQRCKVFNDSREKSLSITKLEEAQMWVKQAMEKTNE